MAMTDQKKLFIKATMTVNEREKITKHKKDLERREGGREGGREGRVRNEKLEATYDDDRGLERENERESERVEGFPSGVFGP